MSQTCYYLPHLVDIAPIINLLSDPLKASLNLHIQKLSLMQQSMSLSIESLNTIPSTEELRGDRVKMASDILIEMDSYTCTLTHIWTSCEWVFTREYSHCLQFRFDPLMKDAKEDTPKHIMGRVIDTMRGKTYELSRAVDQLKRATIEAANHWVQNRNSSTLRMYADSWKVYIKMWQRFIQEIHQQIHHVRVFARMM